MRLLACHLFGFLVKVSSVRLPACHRCGPFDKALEGLQDARVRKLANSMVDAVFPLREGLAAIAKAQEKGVLKVHVQP
jgi:hypothetical protein